ncbi:MAG: hypothetical protein ABH883_03020 [Candidatus Omnitrophota bacterium]
MPEKKRVEVVRGAGNIFSVYGTGGTLVVDVNTLFPVTDGAPGKKNILEEISFWSLLHGIRRAMLWKGGQDRDRLIFELANILAGARDFLSMPDAAQAELLKYLEAEGAGKTGNTALKEVFELAMENSGDDKNPGAPDAGKAVGINGQQWLLKTVPVLNELFTGSSGESGIKDEEIIGEYEKIDGQERECYLRFMKTQYKHAHGMEMSEGILRGLKSLGADLNGLRRIHGALIEKLGYFTPEFKRTLDEDSILWLARAGGAYLEKRNDTLKKNGIALSMKFLRFNENALKILQFNKDISSEEDFDVMLGLFARQGKELTEENFEKFISGSLCLGTHEAEYRKVSENILNVLRDEVESLNRPVERIRAKIKEIKRRIDARMGKMRVLNAMDHMRIAYNKVLIRRESRRIDYESIVRRLFSETENVTARMISDVLKNDMFYKPLVDASVDDRNRREILLKTSGYVEKVKEEISRFLNKKLILEIIRETVASSVDFELNQYSMTETGKKDFEMTLDSMCEKYANDATGRVYARITGQTQSGLTNAEEIASLFKRLSAKRPVLSGITTAVVFCIMAAAVLFYFLSGLCVGISGAEKPFPVCLMFLPLIILPADIFRMVLIKAVGKEAAVPDPLDSDKHKSPAMTGTDAVSVREDVALTEKPRNETDEKRIDTGLDMVTDPFGKPEKSEALKTAAAVIRYKLLEASGDKDFAEAFADAVFSFYREKRRIVFAFDVYLGERQGEKGIKLIEMIEDLKSDHRYSEFLGNMEVIRFDTTRRDKKGLKSLQERIDMGALVFSFARDTGQARKNLKDMGNRNNHRLSYINDRKVSEILCTEKVYYPIFEIVTITLARYMDEMPLEEIKNVGEKAAITAEEQGGMLIFTILPSIKHFETNKEQVQYYAAKKQILLAA